ncbi:hypothetical protein Adt_27404 [Abeliophyllum distichum]|uniref:Uncharacterized protein n=1 Tax=Abeliophyllum distichum TaxID=126358 RepID=A0ABD1RUD0_9LAMI
MKRKCISVEGSSKKMKNIAELKLEVNDVRITNVEKNVAYTEGLFENCQSQGQNANEDDDFEHLVIHQSKLMITTQESLVGDDSSSNLKKKKIRHYKSNEEILKRLAEIEVKLQSNEEILKRLAEIESIDQDIINFNEEDWKIVNDVAAHSLAKKMHQDIDVNDDGVELKDEDWQKIDEIAASVSAKYKLEEAITDDEVTPDAPLKRENKPVALLQSSWVNQHDFAVGTSMVGNSTVGTSSVGTTKRVVKGTSTFKVGLCFPCRPDVEAFESWYKQRLVTKKSKYVT